MSFVANLVRAVLRQWLVWALGTSAAMLAIAHAFETFGKLAPCILCLDQREVYWVAMTVAAVGIAARFTPLKRRLEPLFCWALAAIFLFGLGVAVRHAGAEWDFWDGPAACAAATNARVTAADMAELLSGAKLKMPSCEEAAWRMFGISMAGYNAIISLKLVIYSVLAALGWAPGARRQEALA